MMGPRGNGFSSMPNENSKTEHFDYFVFGHRHLPLEIPSPQIDLYQHWRLDNALHLRGF